MKKKVQLDSGNILELDYTSFRNTQELIRTLSHVIQTQINKFKIDSNFTDISIDSLKNELISKVIPLILSAVESEELVDVIIKCGDNCIINEERVSLDYFEDVNNRQDYFKVLQEIAWYNIEPFFKGAITRSKNLKVVAPQDSKKQ